MAQADRDPQARGEPPETACALSPPTRGLGRAHPNIGCLIGWNAILLLVLDNLDCHGSVPSQIARWSPIRSTRGSYSSVLFLLIWVNPLGRPLCTSGRCQQISLVEHGSLRGQPGRPHDGVGSPSVAMLHPRSTSEVMAAPVPARWLLPRPD